MSSSSNSSSDLSEKKLKDQQHPTPASRRCPNCDHELGCNPDMVGFPAGVKFDPSDQELIEHLESMVKEGGSRAHPLIGAFIPTLQGNDGICYTHPENLPGVTRDGLSKHFFHISSKAYPSGTRKRRKIHSCDNVGEAHWHKTGKTRPVIVGGQQKGCKKTLVLYSTYGKQGKTNWVMHQYHLGSEEEKNGELVVSKVFYQQTQLRSTVKMMEQNNEKVEVTSEAMKDMLPGCGVEAADTMIQMQYRNKRGRFGKDEGRDTPATSSRRTMMESPRLAVEEAVATPVVPPGFTPHHHQAQPVVRSASPQVRGRSTPVSSSRWMQMEELRLTAEEAALIPDVPPGFAPHHRQPQPVEHLAVHQVPDPLKVFKVNENLAIHCKFSNDSNDESLRALPMPRSREIMRKAEELHVLLKRKFYLHGKDK